MKKSLLLALCIISCTFCISLKAQDATYPEVTTMEELVAALGDNDQSKGVTVLFKNLKPVFEAKGLTINTYMPDNTTPIQSQLVVPTEADVVGKYYFNNDYQGFRFEIDTFTNIYSFHSFYYTKNYYEQTQSTYVTENTIATTAPMVVTAVDGNNVYVQYQSLEKEVLGDLIVVDGAHSLVTGNKLVGTKTKFVPAQTTSSDEENSTVTAVAHFSALATDLGTITTDGEIQYSIMKDLSIAESASAVILPTGGTITEYSDKFFYNIGEKSIELKSTAVNLVEWVNKTISEMIYGVATTDDKIIVNKIEALDTNHATIADWIKAAKNGMTVGSLKNPIAVTLAAYQSSQSYIFIQDETGALCLYLGYNKYQTVKTGDMITGVKGELSYLNASNAIVAPKVTMAITDTTGIEIVGTNDIQPIDVTIAELNADEEAAASGEMSQYANKLIRLKGVKKGSKWVGNNPRVYPFIQGEDTLCYATNTLNSFSAKLDTKPMSITAIVDFQTINQSKLYSIYPRSNDDIINDILTPPTFTPRAGTYELEVDVTIKSFDESVFAIYYTLDGSEPSDENGEEYIDDPIKLTTTTTIKAIALYQVERENPYSEITEATYIITQKPTNVDDATITAIVYSINGNVVVETEEGNMIDIYTIQGQKIYSAEATSNISTINALGNNLLLVRINGETIKVAVK